MLIAIIFGFAYISILHKKMAGLGKGCNNNKRVGLLGRIVVMVTIMIMLLVTTTVARSGPGRVLLGDPISDLLGGLLGGNVGGGGSGGGLLDGIVGGGGN